MTELDKKKLLKFHFYEQIEWMKETQKLFSGDSFLQEVNSHLPSGHFEFHCLENSYFAILTKKEHEKLLKKIEMR